MGRGARGRARCRIHGGLSTGPKTSDEIARIRRAVNEARLVFGGCANRAPAVPCAAPGSLRVDAPDSG
ncbi:MAG: HGGxSTG domain-containing protein [Bryobacteraceae bacterium]